MSREIVFDPESLILQKHPPRKATSHKIPFGYKWYNKEEKLIGPDYDIIKYLEYGMDRLDEGATLREITEWIVDQTGLKLSHMGLDKIWKRLRPMSPRREAYLKQERKKKRERKLTRQEILERNRKRQIAKEKRKITFAKRKIDKLADEIEEIDKYKDSSVVEIDYSLLDLNTQEDEVPRETIFKPNPGPQTEFLEASELEVLYGGAAGGGKSYALIADPLRYFDNKNFNGLLLRRTNDELRELIWKSQELYKAAYPKAQWKEKDKTWIFPSGARLWMTYLERDEDVLRYQGQAFTWIGIDELTQYSTPFAWNYLRSRLRTTDPELSRHLCMRATTNPGGPGHGWVKKMFIDPSPANKSFWATDIDNGQVLINPKTEKPLFKRRFIPARLYDNPFFNDGVYESNLLSLPEQQRRQLLDGDWNVADGAAFREFRESLHTCDPFEIPHEWRRFRSCDYGYSSAAAVHWYAIDPDGQLIVYRELYTNNKTGKELARMVLEMERGEKIIYGVLDSSVWAKRGETGPSIAEEMISEGCRWRPSDRSPGSRIAGKNRLHELLKPILMGDKEKPGIVFFNTCRQIITDLPIIPVDPKGGDDIDPRYATDHAYDSIRYGIMSRPSPRTFFDNYNETPRHFKPSDSIFGY